MITRVKYRVFISDYQPYRYFDSQLHARLTLKAEGYGAYEIAKWNKELKMYTDRKMVWL